MDSVHVFLRNSDDFNAIICRFSDGREEHKLKMYGYLSHEATLNDLKSERKNNTQSLVNICKNRNIGGVYINVKGPFKVNDILDISILQASGIQILDIVDVTLPEASYDYIKQILIRKKII